MLIIRLLYPYKNRTFLYGEVVLCTKCVFVHFSTKSTILYKNRAVFKYLIFNVINSEKQGSARKHKNSIVFIQGIFVRRKNNKKNIYTPRASVCFVAKHCCSKRFLRNEGRRGEWKAKKRGNEDAHAPPLPEEYQH